MTDRAPSRKRGTYTRPERDWSMLPYFLDVLENLYRRRSTGSSRVSYCHPERPFAQWRVVVNDCGELQSWLNMSLRI